MNDKERLELLKVKLSMAKVSKQVGWFHEWVDRVLFFLDDPNPDTDPFSGFNEDLESEFNEDSDSDEEN